MLRGKNPRDLKLWLMKNLDKKQIIIMVKQKPLHKQKLLRKRQTQWDLNDSREKQRAVVYFVYGILEKHIE